MFKELLSTDMVTCPCGGHQLGLAASTVSFGGVGCDGEGVGSFRL